MMRPLNLTAESTVPASAGAPHACREVRFGNTRVFLDPGTLSAWAAEAPEERAPASLGLEPEFPPPASSKVRAVVLSVTHGCNLACRYCYVRRRAGLPRSSLQIMSRETARNALRLLSPPGPWRVGFFGGEPLLAWDLVREVTELAREKARRQGARVRFAVTTNGTLLTEERARFLAEHGFSLIISLDGPKDLHDRERVFKTNRDSQDVQDGVRRKQPVDPVHPCLCGRGSFERARHGLDVAAAAGLGPRTTLRATFPLERPALRERLEFLNGLADGGLARAVSVEPAWPAPSEIMERAQLASLPPEYLAAARWAVSRLRSGKRVRYHHLEKALGRILLRRPAGSECGAGFGYVEVAPSGEIYACHKETGGPVGHVDSGISERLRAPWRENRRYAREGCARCWARNVCGGGCRAESIEHMGDIARPWPAECAMKRLQVRAALYVAARAPRRSLEDMFARRIRRGRGAANALRHTS